MLDTEDHRFYQHGGFDIPSTIRALANDSSGKSGIQGGSTIAQQLVKQTYLSSARKLSRKIKEAVLGGRFAERQRGGAGERDGPGFLAHLGLPRLGGVL